MKNKKLFSKRKWIYPIFWILTGIFIVLISSFIVPDSVIIKQAIFPFIAILAFAFFLSGIVLIILTIKAKVKGPLKKFLILTGASAAGFLISVILHNFYYALAIVTGSYLMEIYHVAFFLLGIPICPICFLIGAIGSIVLFIKKRKH